MATETLEGLSSGIRSGRPDEEEEFFEFSKKHLATLTALASLPLITGALGVLEPPKGFKQLSLLASALSVIAFGSVYLGRGLLSWCTRRKRRVFVLVFGVLLAVSLTGLFAGQYAELAGKYEVKEVENVPARFESGAKSSPDTQLSYVRLLETPVLTPRQAREEIWYYLTTYASLSFTLGLLLVTAYGMNRPNTIQRIICESLMEEAAGLEREIRWLARFHELSAGNDARIFRTIAEETVLNERRRELEYLSRGTIELHGEQAGQFLIRMHKHYRKSFDAVSAEDIKFWSGRHDRFADDYFGANVDAVKDGTNINRIFVVTDGELSSGEQVWNILKDQRQMGWAFVPSSGVEFMAPNGLKRDLDFGLFDFATKSESNGDHDASRRNGRRGCLPRASSTFTGEDRSRRLQVHFGVTKSFGLEDGKDEDMAVLGCDQASTLLIRRAVTYLELIIQGWFINKEFEKSLARFSSVLDVLREHAKRHRVISNRADKSEWENLDLVDQLKYFVVSSACVEAKIYGSELLGNRIKTLENSQSILKQKNRQASNDLAKHDQNPVIPCASNLDVAWGDCFLLGVAPERDDEFAEIFSMALRMRRASGTWKGQKHPGGMKFDIGLKLEQAGAVQGQAKVTGFKQSPSGSAMLLSAISRPPEESEQASPKRSTRFDLSKYKWEVNGTEASAMFSFPSNGSGAQEVIFTVSDVDSGYSESITQKIPWGEADKELHVV